ncbi:MULTISPECIES: TetR/AcrR family transcriptional regulator [Pseudofrankia]|uniref:TetR/AcrR family transcriptional regulator n=1 Tax=Pseudofrankia TaxID=2994363 RepID=UPI000234B911|nr:MULTISPECIES: TetR/AcrR family transcriptional regulator [Pseudofrankia]OHV29807.1 TetR family transcriptional regulator [Pseudofrankia sp. EUN1h]
MPRPKRRTPELRDRVLSAATDLLAREGVAGFTARGVARAAGTSTPAVYELFGDKGGLVREMFFAGFRLLGQQLHLLADTDDPRADLIRLVLIYRDFVRDNPVLSQVMFSRPFSDFDPEPEELEASSAVRIFIVVHVRRCIDAGVLQGDETDIAHIVIALTQGLAAAEIARRLGTSPKSINRRWELGLNALLAGLARHGSPEP